jgi:hypothetical protein
VEGFLVGEFKNDQFAIIDNPTFTNQKIRKAVSKDCNCLGYLATNNVIKTRFVTAADLVILLETAHQ